MSDTIIHGIFTRKQAGTLYAAHKSGNILMTRKQIDAMYDLVNCPHKDMSAEQRKLHARLKDALDFVCMDEYELAQDCINGKVKEDSFERYACAADVDRFSSWDVQPEYISIEPRFGGYRIVC